TPPPPAPTLFPYTTLFRSNRGQALHSRAEARPEQLVNRQKAAAEISGNEKNADDDASDQVADHQLQEREVAASRIGQPRDRHERSEEHTSELQSLAYLVCR